jgi:phosphoglycolate phosphatase-like HAD superfamily hydrolase
MIRAMALDFDDVLIATAETSADNVIQALIWYRAQTGAVFRVPSRDELMDGYSPSWREGIRKAVPGLDVDAFKRFYDAQRSGLRTYPLIPGALEAVGELKREVSLLGIVTNRSRKTLCERAEQAGLDLGMFDFYFTEQDMPKPKPDPRAFDPMLNRLSQESIRPCEAVYVGDQPADFEATLGTGIGFRGVRTGPLREMLDIMRDSGHLIFDSITELPGHVRSHNEESKNADLYRYRKRFD